MRLGLYLRTSNYPPAHAVAIAGQSHGRVVVARGVPEILSAGEARRIATGILAHSVGGSMSRNRRLGDCRQMMVRRQEKPWWVSLLDFLDGR